LLGLGLYAKAAVQYGQHAQGYQLSFVEPYLLGYRIAWGLDLSTKVQKSTQFTSYETRTTGGATRFGFALREDVTLQLRYSLFSQKVTLPGQLQNCNNINPDFSNTFPTPNALNSTPATTPPPGFTGQTDCFADGEASLAVRRELAAGAVLTSMVRYDLSYNTLENNRHPTSGILAILRQDFAGAGGDVSYLRTTANVRSYYEVLPDVVSLLTVQGGIINGFGGRALEGEGTNLRMLDHFQMGPQLVRGFSPSGIGPRDLTQFNFNGSPGDALGGSLYWGASMEFQTPIYFLPKDAGVKMALFADAGSLWDYKGPL